MKNINTMLIGLGYHARRIYAPYLSSSQNANFSCFYDLKNQQEIIENYLNEKSIGIPGYYTENTDISDNLNAEDKRQLNKLIKKYDIKAVVISTEPLAHTKYVRWALENDLHILLDKPISTEINVSTDFDKASKLFLDYLDIEKTYKKKPKIVFTLQAQRRYHEGYLYVRNKIIEMTQLTNCPVTSVQAFHSDGQWRFPDEIIEQTYHPYNQGYGKMSHSGYHSLDIASWFAEASIPKEKLWDNFVVYSQFVRPSDFTAQLRPDDYKKLFKNFDPNKLVSSEKMKRASVEGEIDAFSNISLRSGENIITSITTAALHNGFGQRNWTSAEGRDLYKGNGRIRQESYIVEQGPFQSIIINSFQSKELLSDEKAKYEIGGEYHFDIHIFRNNTLFPQYKAYELVKINDLRPVRDLGYSRGHQEEARRNCADEFFDAIINGRSLEDQKSNFLQHKLSTQLLSAIYKSGALSYNGKEAIVHERINA